MPSSLTQKYTKTFNREAFHRLFLTQTFSCPFDNENGLSGGYRLSTNERVT